MWRFRTLLKRDRKDKEIGDYFVMETAKFPSERWDLQAKAPLADTDLEPLEAEEAAKLLCGGDSLIGKRIKGDLILGNPDLSFNYEITFSDGQKAIIPELPSIPDRIIRKPFKHKIDIDGCILEGRFCIAGLWFKDRVNIRDTRFCGKVDFQHSTFDREIRVCECCFESQANFNDTTYFGSVSFDKSEFVERVQFYHTEYCVGASYSESHFRSNCNFACSRFRSPDAISKCLDLSGVECEESAFFSGGKFEGLIDFSDAQFRGRAEFSDAEFRYVRFMRAKFTWLGLVWEQIIGEKILFGTVIMPGSKLPKTITNDEIDKLFKRRKDAPLPEKHRQYDILKNLFQRQGDYVSADGCFYEWKQIERRDSPLGWKPQNWIVKAFHYMNWASCGYGVMPIRTLVFASFNILLFALVYSAIDPTFVSIFRSNLPALHVFLEGVGMFVQNLEFSFLAFMNFTAVDAMTTALAHTLFVVERLLGWFTLLLFVTTYTRIMLR
ncbi:MAG: pentapeptide repeat-containing protein [Planctomycetota bacterium]|jgi:hypothetical protein